MMEGEWAGLYRPKEFFNKIQVWMFLYNAILKKKSVLKYGRAV